MGSYPGLTVLREREVFRRRDGHCGVALDLAVGGYDVAWGAAGLVFGVTNHHVFAAEGVNGPLAVCLGLAFDLLAALLHRLFLLAGGVLLSVTVWALLAGSAVVSS